MRDPQHYLLPFLSGIPFGLEFRRNVEFASTSSRSLRLHFARPRRRKRPLPAVLYVFGGGWRGGSPDQGALLISTLALRGYFAASIDYRLSHEAQFPAQLEDCQRAVGHLLSHSTAYGLDPQRIGAWGLSAGGHLASLLATSGDSTESRSHLRAVVTWSAPFDLLRIAELQSTLDDPNTMSAALIGGALRDHPDKARMASAKTHLPTNTPPFLIVHGEDDRLVPPSQSVEMHEALRAKGGESELLLLPKKGHAFLGIGALNRSLAFLDRHLKRDGSHR